jgi:hypothetical protein
MKKIAIIFILILFFFACTERPIESDAEKYFKNINPNSEIVSVRIDEDEVACRTFEIVYKDNSGKTRKNAVLYFDDSNEPYWKIVDTDK